MQRSSLHQTKAWIALAVLAAIVAGGALALSPTQGRRALLAQLQTAATPAPTAASYVHRSSQGYSILATLTPNRAGGPNSFSLRVSRNGRPVDGAHVRVGFSMPSMNMWNAYTAALSASAGGRYGANIPVLGMAGLWRLRIDVTSPSGRRIQFTIDDRLVA